ncbi:hypothetical protein NAEGRDRAFT_48420 [Naegleria gruberi]|uniref:FAD-binding PCMH-type domain-containing protein n=1 Tax=Naegleria gruberi TaxID=5762 RepID=D2VCG3_NAEGR|nr:uncharacterized protein NAEGRDRAFT_48420 [Naegleria gruberi]EFC45302.1 hypothetical protein NAEGRDRAFT_48420 [Naegleria gruberi]|eukprot:XP_002678046.1 hypothetical protein NAEGRDRAFT_48420 [Naegleria gruberi strain NEG-M]
MVMNNKESTVAALLKSKHTGSLVSNSVRNKMEISHANLSPIKPYMQEEDVEYQQHEQHQVAVLHENMYLHLGNFRMERALEEWSNIFSPDQICTDPNMLKTLLQDCSAMEQVNQVRAVIYPTDKEQIVKLVKISNKFKIPIYPVSTGNNWGYGSMNPPPQHDVSTNSVREGIILNMSRMTEIKFDIKSGVVTVQPGVTQRLLNQYLKDNNLSYLIPVTGGGPDTSLLGNALERGYGITPHADHFSACMSLEAILPNGEVYNSMLHQMGAPQIDKLYKWGTGPYVCGIFTQGNFGIVTEMSIALATRPERVEAFFFAVDELDVGVQKVKEILTKIGNVTGSINLMNNRRMISMTLPYPKEKIGKDQVIPDEMLSNMQKSIGVSNWNGAGTIYGSEQVVKAAKKEIKKILKQSTRKIIFLNPKETSTYCSILDKVSFVQNIPIVKALYAVNESLKLMNGEPSQVALPLAYWKAGKKPTEKPMNPSQDGCGLLWFAPLVPLHPENVQEFVELAQRVCIKHGIEPLITLTSMNDRACDSTIPILFDRSDPEQVKKAHQCFDELFEEGSKLGYVPYRLNVNAMRKVSDRKAVPSILKSLKTAIDPNNIIAPGRYGL